MKLTKVQRELLQDLADEGPFFVRRRQHRSLRVLFRLGLVESHIVEVMSHQERWWQPSAAGRAALESDARAERSAQAQEAHA
ncbi:hypothetical protein CA606_18045 [Caulobacter vibrioides]|uniref:Uncharacterized protein n=1 Tax=Caulobacter vibrioides TaxID=155892 RepID=A0A290MPU3_CAUVI|nr:hypothetical protein CA606_18045 [Caulobacter vibrioides]